MTGIITFILKLALILGGGFIAFIGLLAEAMKPTVGIEKPVWILPFIIGMAMVCLGVFWFIFP